MILILPAGTERDIVIERCRKEVAPLLGCTWTKKRDPAAAADQEDKKEEEEATGGGQGRKESKRQQQRKGRRKKDQQKHEKERLKAFSAKKGVGEDASIEVIIYVHLIMIVKKSQLDCQKITTHVFRVLMF